jgi:hypothetical protein
MMPLCTRHGSMVTLGTANAPTTPRMVTKSPEQADTQNVAKKRRGEDPVARFQEEARWSSFTNRWTRAVAPGPPRWFRRMIIGAFVLMAVVGFVVGLIGLVTHNW